MVILSQEDFRKALHSPVQAVLPGWADVVPATLVPKHTSQMEPDPLSPLSPSASHNPLQHWTPGRPGTQSKCGQKQNLFTLHGQIKEISIPNKLCDYVVLPEVALKVNKDLFLSFFF